MTLDYSKIVLKDLKNQINEEKYQELKKAAEPKRHEFLIKHSSNGIIDYPYIAKRAHEVTYIGSKYKDKNKYEQAIILSHIFFSNNKKFAEILLAGDFDKDTLDNLLNLLEYITNKKATCGLDEMDKQYEKSCHTLILQINKHLKKYIGNIDKGEIIINKISEIITYQPELLEKKSSNKKFKK